MIKKKELGVSLNEQLAEEFQNNLKDSKDEKSMRDLKTIFGQQIDFIEVVNKSKPKKLWVDQGRIFYNKLMQECLNNNNILMYSTHNEGMSVIAQRSIKNIKG